MVADGFKASTSHNIRAQSLVMIIIFSISVQLTACRLSRLTWRIPYPNVKSLSCIHPRDIRNAILFCGVPLQKKTRRDKTLFCLPEQQNDKQNRKNRNPSALKVQVQRKARRHRMWRISANIDTEP